MVETPSAAEPSAPPVDVTPAPPVPLGWLEVPMRLTQDARLAEDTRAAELRTRGKYYQSPEMDPQEPRRIAAKLGARGGRPTKVDDDRIKALFAQNPRISLSSMAKRLGVDRSTIRPAYHRLKPPPR